MNSVSCDQISAGSEPNRVPFKGKSASVPSVRFRAIPWSNLFCCPRIDTEFHQRVCELSGSRILLRVWLPLFTQLRRFITQAHERYFPLRTEIADGHQPLVDALRSRDPKKAEAAITQHILVSWARMNADQQPENPKVSVRKKTSR